MFFAELCALEHTHILDLDNYIFVHVNFVSQSYLSVLYQNEPLLCFLYFIKVQNIICVYSILYVAPD